MARVFLNQRHSVFTRGPCLIKSAPQCSLCHASVSWSVLGVVVVLKARPSWVKLKSWLIPSSTTPRGYYFHPFPDDRAEGAKYRFSGFTPNKQTNKQTKSRKCVLECSPGGCRAESKTVLGKAQVLADSVFDHSQGLLLPSFP